MEIPCLLMQSLQFLAIITGKNLILDLLLNQSSAKFWRPKNPAVLCGTRASSGQELQEAPEQLCIPFPGYRALGHWSWIKILKAFKTQLLSKAQIPG